MGYKGKSTNSTWIQSYSTASKNRFKDEGANIRETPSLNGNIIDSLVADETATFLDEEKTDSNGIKWLKVETSTGAIGWISSRIVEEE
jgi:hypothetical protein